MRTAHRADGAQVGLVVGVNRRVTPEAVFAPAFRRRVFAAVRAADRGANRPAVRACGIVGVARAAVSPVPIGSTMAAGSPPVSVTPPSGPEVGPVKVVA